MFKKKTLAVVTVVVMLLSIFGCLPYSATSPAQYDITFSPVSQGKTTATFTLSASTAELCVALIKFNATNLTIVEDGIKAPQGLTVSYSAVDDEGDDAFENINGPLSIIVEVSQPSGTGTLADVAELSFTIEFEVNDGTALTLDRVAAASVDENRPSEDNDGNVSVVVNPASTTIGNEGGITIPTEEATCEHEWVLDSIDQPTITKTGTKHYSCSKCPETKDETIAVPTDMSSLLTLKNDLFISSCVGDRIGFSNKKMKNNGYNEYFIVVDYQKYGQGYVLENKTYTIIPTAEDMAVNMANYDFKDISLYELTLGFSVTAYVKDSDGVVVGYTTVNTSIADIALAYATTYSSNTALLKMLADMAYFGASTQSYFAENNPGTPICDATLPTTVLADYMSYASSGTPASSGQQSAPSFDYDYDFNTLTDLTDKLTLKGDLFISSCVGDRLGFSNKKMKNNGYNDYYLSVDYQKYGQGYVIANTKASFNPTAAEISSVNMANYDFSDISLYELTLEFAVTAYVKNDQGTVIGYTTMNTSIADIALAYASTYSSNTALLTMLADMAYFGASTQSYFAENNQGTPICDAILPTTVLADYLSYASSNK